MPVGVLRFDGNDGAGRIWLGGALFALSPAPAAGDDQSRLVREDDLAHLWMLHLALPQRCVALTTVGEMDRDGSLNGAGVEDRDGERVTNANQVADIDQQVDAGYLALLGQAA